MHLVCTGDIDGVVTLIAHLDVCMLLQNSRELVVSGVRRLERGPISVLAVGSEANVVQVVGVGQRRRLLKEEVLQ